MDYRFMTQKLASSPLEICVLDKNTTTKKLDEVAELF